MGDPDEGSRPHVGTIVAIGGYAHYQREVSLSEERDQPRFGRFKHRYYPVVHIPEESETQVNESENVTLRQAMAPTFTELVAMLFKKGQECGEGCQKLFAVQGKTTLLLSSL